MRSTTLLILLAHLSASPAGGAQGRPAPAAAVRDSFAFLYALPADTAAAPMESWVLDTAATSTAFDPSGRWRIVVTKLTDTGNNLQLRELAGQPGTSPTELAAAAAGIQKLEAQISRAEAEASMEVTIAIGAAAAAARIEEGQGWRDAGIPGAARAVRRDGHWVRARDHELEIDVERWTPAALIVDLGHVVVTARGNGQMVDRVIAETRWSIVAGSGPG